MRHETVTVSTVLLPTERARVEAAGQGCFTALHGESLADAIRHVRRSAVDAIFLSVHRCAERDVPQVARFVREFPHIPAVALITRPDADATLRVLNLGASGVRAVVDVSQPSGWDRLRELVREPSSPVAARIMAALDPELREAPRDCWLFFELLARRASELRTVRTLAAELEVECSSLMTRFFRAELPSPKVYLAFNRLVHAAHLFRNVGLSVADVSNRLDYSSPQSFGRHLRNLLGVTAGEFRHRYPFETALSLYRERLIAPHREVLLAFHPFGTWPRGPRTTPA
jgi:AraC-like DNA-binding protein